MARIVYSGLIESIRGSIAGTTFQKNAYGYTVKKKPNIISPNTSLQNRQKKYLALATQAWGELTTVQRADWDTWASTYPQYAKHNPSSQLSGYAVFTRTHVFKFMSGQSVTTNPAYSLAPADTVVSGLISDAGVLTHTIDSVTDDEAWRILVFISRQFKGSQNFVGTKPKFIDWTTNDDQQNVITDEYTAIYGTIPVAGDRCAVDLQLFNEGNGQIAARQSDIVTVTAS